MTTKIHEHRTMNETLTGTLDTVAGGLASEALRRPEIVKALESAKYAMSIVVTDAASRQMATGALLEVQRGIKAVTEARKPLKIAMVRISEAVKSRFGPIEGLLTEAVEYLEQQVKSSLEAERRASEEARDAEAARVRAAEEAARQGEGGSGAKAPPPAQRYIPPVETQVKAGPQGSVHLTHTLEVLAEDFSKIPAALLQLDTAAARGWAQDMIRRGVIVVPKDGTEVRVNGLVLRYRTDLAKRVG